MSRFSEAERACRLANLPQPTYPNELPIVAKRAEIMRAIDENQVVIVCGETGSGKTTQLPKLCLELKRGIAGMIGHTQPRRIAARTVAARMAVELKSTLGHAVGYKVRFSDHVSPDTYIKVMTDGILLAETQRDRLLAAYDTLIIDEAHERSLNIDFLLGYVQRLLGSRPDLKLIVTSATIDAERFARHFAQGGKPAPVIEVSGRLYPVEVRYRPLHNEDDDEEEDLEQAIIDAVDELTREASSGDILVFLPGEREIRDTAEALRKHHPPATEILPLYARMSFEAQQAVFEPTGRRRIVLATNVAETSLTVPGIRYVLDSGLARINRYSYRNKVEQLQIEKISRASANQRAGRCGRVAAGICIRLYGEEDYLSRPEFGDPEILRSSLAGVILRMKALKIGNPEDFPFLDPPAPRMIADGYQLLGELGAVDERNQLTRIGWQLAKFPIDPRIARMVLAGQQHHCLDEILTIAAALEVQDPRERPFDEAARADEAHSQFADQRSDFMGFLKLWEFFEHALEHKKSNRKLSSDLQASFLSRRRMREWRDIRGQLHSLAAEMGMHPGETPATYEQIHRALIAGLLGNVGVKSEEGDVYVGARETKFAIFPGSALKRVRPKWIVAAELTDTARLYARCVAKIEPEWVEAAASHLVRRHYVDPRWDRSKAMVVAFERVTLYGLTLISRRRVHYGPIDPAAAREVFLRNALAACEYDTKAKFYAHNVALINEIRGLEHKARRPDVLVDEEALFQFYDSRVPAPLYNGAGFEAWRKEAERENPRILYMDREYLMRHSAEDVSEAQFPDHFRVNELAVALTYRFDPGHALDGVTLTAPLHALNHLDAGRFEWLVPGLLREKVGYYLKALPKQIRKQLVPVPAQVTAFLESVDADRIKGWGTSLSAALGRFVQRAIGEPMDAAVWKDIELPPHLQMNYRIVDEAGRELGVGRDLAAIKQRLGEAAQLTFGLAEPGIERERIRAWDFGDLPEQIAFTRDGQKLTGYPALVDEDDSVAIRLFDTAAAARHAMRAGVRRLLRLELKAQMKELEKTLPGFTQAALQLRHAMSAAALTEDLLAAIVDRAFIGEAELPRSQAEFNALKERARTRLPAVRSAAAQILAAVASEYHIVSSRLSALPSALNRIAADARTQLANLVYPGVFSATPWERLQHLPRYLKAIVVRLDKYSNAADRDIRHAQAIAELWKLYQERAAKARKEVGSTAALEEFRWQIEELRVSLFAQELRTPMPVSVKRLKKIWAALPA